jgi:hypothetical protein
VGKGDLHRYVAAVTSRQVAAIAVSAATVPAWSTTWDAEANVDASASSLPLPELCESAKIFWASSAGTIFVRATMAFVARTSAHTAATPSDPVAGSELDVVPDDCPAWVVEVVPSDVVGLVLQAAATTADPDRTRASMEDRQNRADRDGARGVSGPSLIIAFRIRVPQVTHGHTDRRRRWSATTSASLEIPSPTA